MEAPMKIRGIAEDLIDILHLHQKTMKNCLLFLSDSRHH